MDRKKLFLTIVALILVAGFLLRLFPVRGGYHYWDEAVYLQHGEILTGESPNNYNEFDFRPPLFSLMVAGVFTISSSLLSAHLAVAAFSTLGIALVYMLGVEFWGREPGAIAAAIYALSPLGIMLSHDILVDPILPVFWLATAFCLTRAIRTGKAGYYGLTGLAAALAVLMKFTSLVILPAIALVVLIVHLQRNTLDVEGAVQSVKEAVLYRNNWLIVAGFLAGFVPYLLWSYLAYGSLFHVFLTAWQKSGAVDPFITYLTGLKYYILVPLYLGVPLYLWKADLEKLENYLPVIFFLSLYIPLQVVIGNKEHRFLMPAVPFLALIAGRGLQKLRSEGIIDRRKLAAAVFAIVMLSSIVLLPSSLPERNVFVNGFETDHWNSTTEEAAYWLKNNTAEDTRVYTNDRYPALGYYSKRQIIWIPEDQPLDQIVGNYITEPGYIYYSHDSPHPHPSFEDLQEDPRFELRKSFENTVYLFYFTGTSE